MTASSVLRQRALQGIFYDGFWKSDHDLLIAFHSNFLSVMHVSEITWFYCKPDMTSSWFLRQVALHAIFLNEFWKSAHDFLIVVNGFPNLNGLEVIRHFLFARDFPTGSEILGVFGENDPRKWKYHRFTGIGCGRVKEYKNKNKNKIKGTGPVYFTTTWGATAETIFTKPGRVAETHDVITLSKI